MIETIILALTAGGVVYLFLQKRRQDERLAKLEKKTESIVVE